MASFEHEQKIWAAGFNYIAGIDEAGRGPLAGPVTVASVILKPDFFHPLVDDSKKLSEEEREVAYDHIVRHAVAYNVVHASVSLIEKINILNATKRAMVQSVKRLSVMPDFLLIDAVNISVPGITQKALIHGDAISISIAAASILAKVTRDRFMHQLDRRYPQYGFSQHKGYATTQHVHALRQYGPSPCHRLSFLRFLSDANGDHTSQEA